MSKFHERKQLNPKHSNQSLRTGNTNDTNVLGFYDAKVQAMNWFHSAVCCDVSKQQHPMNGEKNIDAPLFPFVDRVRMLSAEALVHLRDSMFLQAVFMLEPSTRFIRRNSHACAWKLLPRTQQEMKKLQQKSFLKALNQARYYISLRTACHFLIQFRVWFVAMGTIEIILTVIIINGWTY